MLLTAAQLYQALRDSKNIGAVRGAYNDFVACADGSEGEKHRTAIKALMFYVSEKYELCAEFDAVDDLVSRIL